MYFCLGSPMLSWCLFLRSLIYTIYLLAFSCGGIGSPKTNYHSVKHNSTKFTPIYHFRSATNISIWLTCSCSSASSFLCSRFWLCLGCLGTWRCTGPKNTPCWTGWGDLFQEMTSLTLLCTRLSTLGHWSLVWEISLGQIWFLMVFQTQLLFPMLFPDFECCDYILAI